MRKAALDMVHQLARRDERVVYIGSDPGAGTLDAMKAEFPDRFFIEGIAEANVVGMAAGLAMEGYIPYVNTIATFLTRRCFEQVAVDVCLHGLPVRLIGNGGGLVYAPLGPTHTAIEDMAIMRALPGMAVVAVADADEMRRMMACTLDWRGPIYIRLGKGGDPVVSKEEGGFTLGRGIPMRDGGDVLIVSTGVMTAKALQAADVLDAAVLHLPTVKPLDTAALFRLAEGRRLVATVEEHIRTGGLGSAVLEAFADREAMPVPRLLRLALPDAFVHNYGSQDGLLARFGLDSAGIAKSVREALA
ncbi:MAG: transketolase [Magnetospirillum sp. WYHS-4]